jgi:hypothetical protein
MIGAFNKTMKASAAKPGAQQTKVSQLFLAASAAHGATGERSRAPIPAGAREAGAICPPHIACTPSADASAPARRNPITTRRRHNADPFDDALAPRAWRALARPDSRHRHRRERRGRPVQLEAICAKAMCFHKNPHRYADGKMYYHVGEKLAAEI